MAEDVTLLQRWQQFNDRLEFEIGKAEHQLAGVNARLDDLRRDLWIYIPFATVPFLLACLIRYLQQDVVARPFGKVGSGIQFSLVEILYTVLTIARYISFPLALVSLPVCLFYMVRSVKRYVYHNRTVQWEQPHERLALHEGRNRKALNCYAEREKVVWILNKYYLYRSRMQELKKKIEDSPSRLSEKQLEEQLAGMVFYEEIHPANIKK